MRSAFAIMLLLMKILRGKECSGTCLGPCGPRYCARRDRAPLRRRLTSPTRPRRGAGISLKSIQCFAVAFGARLVSILIYPSYLPFDSSGDWVYRGSEIASFLMALTIIGLMTLHPKVSRSYTAAFDVFGNELLPSKLGAILAIVLAFIVAIVRAEKTEGRA